MRIAVSSEANGFGAAEIVIVHHGHQPQFGTGGRFSN